MFLFLKANEESIMQMRVVSGLPNIQRNSLTALKISSPSNNEQQKISIFLSNLDQLCTLHQHKLDKLKEIKKSLLQKMFPAEGEDTPKIRFKGFTDAWEQHKAENIFKEFVEKTVINNQFPILSSTMAGIFIQTDYFNNQAASSINIGYKVCPLNYFTYRSMSDTGEFHFNLQNIVENGIVSPAYPVFSSPEHNNYFLEYQLNSSIYLKKQILLLKEGGTRFALSFDKFKKLELFTTHDLAEEKKIGQLFENLDSLLTLHQRKLEKLQNIKKALLQKMFPAEGEDTPKIRFKGFTDAWEQVKFCEVFDYERPDSYIVQSEEYEDGAPTPVLTANKGFILGYTYENRTYNKPCVIFDDFTLDSKYVDFKFMVKSSAMKILTAENGYNLYFAYNLLASTKIESLGHARHYISVVQPTEVFAPSISEQLEISKLFTNLDSLLTLHQRE